MASLRWKDRRQRGWKSRKAFSLLPNAKQRTTSNVFSMFDKRQICELSEVFNFIDQDCDGFIDKDDLFKTLLALGEDGVTEEDLEHMIKEAPSYINLTMFLTLFGSKLNGTDPDEIFESAFRCFDSDGTGRIHVGTLTKLLTQTGDKWGFFITSFSVQITDEFGTACANTARYFPFVDMRSRFFTR